MSHISSVLKYDAQRVKKAVMPYLNSKVSDNRVQPCSLIWSSTYSTVSIDSVSISACVVRKLHEGTVYAVRIICASIMKTCLFKYTENFTTKK